MRNLGNIFANGWTTETSNERNLDCILLKWRLVNRASSSSCTWWNEISMVTIPNDTENSLHNRNNTPVWLLDKCSDKMCQTRGTILWRSSNVPIIYNATYCKISRQHRHILTAQRITILCRAKHSMIFCTLYFCPSMGYNSLLKLKAKTTDKQCIFSCRQAHMPSDGDHVLEPRPLADGGATVERPEAVDSWFHCPELSRLLAASDVTMSAQHSGCGLSANGKVPRPARALIASSRFMKHARAWLADLLKKNVCSSPCWRHSDWILGPSSCNNNRSLPHYVAEWHWMASYVLMCR